jgi:CRP/FNR family transcriptional regulator
LFKGLRDVDLRLLAGDARVRAFAADQVIFYQGDLGNTCYVTIHGKVRVFIIGEDGRELSVTFLGPGEIFGEMALFQDEPRSASIAAFEPTHTLELHQDILLRGLQRSPELALQLLRALSDRLRHRIEDAENLISLTVAERLMVRLWRLIEWAGQREVDGIRITFPITQQQLAALVGTSRESINRALSALRRAGKVRFDQGWIVLLDQCH